MRHDGLVECIYDWAGDALGWQHILETLAAALDADKAHLYLLGKEGQLVDSRFHGFQADDIRAYHGDFQAQDPRLHVGRAHPGQVHSDVQVIDPAEFERSALYNELLQRLGVRYTLFVTYPVPEGTAAQAFMRPRSAPAFGDDSVAALTRLLPHLRRGLHLRQLLEAAREDVGDLQRTLDLLPVPVAILDTTGRVRCVSGAAARLLESEHGLRLVQGRLSARDPRTESALAGALAEAARLADAGARSAADAPVAPLPPVIEVQRERGAPPLGLVVMPLRPSSRLRGLGEARARMLVVFQDPGASVQLQPALLQRLYRLTPTEAQLAAALAGGQSLAAFAQARGTSELTARTHLKHVLEKTGTRRQPDLVRVLLTGAAAHLTIPE